MAAAKGRTSRAKPSRCKTPTDTTDRETVSRRRWTAAEKSAGGRGSINPAGSDLPRSALNLESCSGIMLLIRAATLHPSARRDDFQRLTGVKSLPGNPGIPGGHSCPFAASTVSRVGAPLPMAPGRSPAQRRRKFRYVPPRAARAIARSRRISMRPACPRRAWTKERPGAREFPRASIGKENERRTTRPANVAALQTRPRCEPESGSPCAYTR